MSKNPFHRLTTERLFLREIRLDDVAEIFRLRTDDEVNELVDRQKAISPEDAGEYIKKTLVLASKKELVIWAIMFTGEPRLIGTVVYRQIEWDNNKAEIGYELLPEYRGKGVMSETLKEVTDFGFNHLGFKRITAYVKPVNMPSVKLLEKMRFIKLEETSDGYTVYQLTP